MLTENNRRSNEKDSTKATEMEDFKSSAKQYSKLIVLYMFVYSGLVDFALLLLAFYCVKRNYTGSLTWFSVGGAFGTTMALFGTIWSYMQKSTKENTQGGIVYDKAMKERDC